MNDTLLISNVLVWVVLLALLLAVLALARQVGILHERIAPMGALMMDAGPQVGDMAPALALESLAGGTLSLGQADTRSRLLFFLSPSCPVCKKLLPVLKSIQSAESCWLDVVLASDGDRPQHDVFRQRAGLTSFPYVLSAELGMQLRIGKLPYAVLLDHQGRIRAKGLVNSREQIESLFTASELGVASVQDYLAPASPFAGHAQRAPSAKEHA